MAKRKTLFSPRTETGVGGVRGGTEGKDSETVGTERGDKYANKCEVQRMGTRSSTASPRAGLMSPLRDLGGILRF